MEFIKIIKKVVKKMLDNKKVSELTIDELHDQLEDLKATQAYEEEHQGKPSVVTMHRLHLVRTELGKR